MPDAQKNALDSDLLTSIAKQMLTRSRVKVGGKLLPGSSHKLTTTPNSCIRDERAGVSGSGAVGQNLEEPSRWGQLAGSGHQVVQIKDGQTNNLIPILIGGNVKVYGRP